MTFRGVGVGAVAAVVGALAAPTASAAPAGDAIVEVTAFSIAHSGAVFQQTAVAMCPSGMRATGGGAAPSPPYANGTFDGWRLNYSSPVEESGLAASTSGADVPRGWLVVVTTFGDNPTDPEPFKAFAICSASSDAVLAESQPGGPGDITATAQCSGASRAIGGGVGPITTVTAGVTAPLLYETGPVDETSTVAATQSGDVARGWRSVSQSSAFGNRFFAVCSAGSDATVKSTAFTLRQDPGGFVAGGAAASCAAGQRALSGGLAVDSAHDPNDRVEFSAPGASVASFVTTQDGAVPMSWFAAGQASSTQARTYRTFATCATGDVPPAPPPVGDTTPPNVELKGNKKQRLGKPVKVKISCDEACAVVAKGKAKAKGGKAVKLKGVTARLTAGENETVKLGLSKDATRKLQEADQAVATITATATDAAGNSSRANRKVTLG